jgi:hypothetical protein
MKRNSRRLKGFRFAPLLLALGFFTVQGSPADAFVSPEGGEIDLGFTEEQGELPKHPGNGGGPGGDPGTRRADPDDLSFNNPRVDNPVVAVPASTPPARHQGWVLMLRFWLESLVAHLVQLHR